MTRVPIIVVIALSVVSLGACSTGGSPTTSSASKMMTSTGSSSKFAYAGPVTVVKAPAAVCPASPEIPEMPPAAAWDAKAAPVIAKRATSGWTLNTAGAPLGAVVAELGSAAGKPLFASGPAANIGIWARLEDEQLGTIIERLAESTGTTIVADGGGFLLVPPQRAVQMQRANKAAHVDLGPVETRILKVAHPAQFAPLLAWTALGCTGKLTAVPSRGWLIAQDTADRLARIEAILNWASADDYTALDGQYVADRRPTYGVPDAAAATCMPHTAATNTGGQPVGELIIDSTHGDIVVGCGASRRVHAQTLALTQNVLRTLGLARLNTEVYASARLSQPAAAATSATLSLRSFQSSNPDDLARLIQAQLADVRTLVYRPRSAVLVAAGDQRMGAVATLVKQYQKAADK